MKIIATADLHGSFPEVPPCDLLLIAGDVCSRWDHSLRFQLSWLDTNFRFWLEETRKNSATAIVGIAGNHDFVFERWPDEVRKLDLPWFYLQDSVTEFTIREESLKIYGLPWVPNLSRWAFHDDDHGLDRRFDAVPEDADIVMSHGPPHMYCDLTVPMFGACNAGFPGMNKMLKRVKPKALICGHIHEAYGMADHPSGARIYNVSHMTETYEAKNPPLVIDLERTEAIPQQSRTHSRSSRIFSSNLPSRGIHRYNNYSA